MLNKYSDSDSDDMSRQIRTLYACSNHVVRIFHNLLQYNGIDRTWNHQLVCFILLQ